ncbi:MULTISPECIES: IS1-like element transposase, partial [Enterobacteriaceae]|uniref:IS1-like element transposase n=1 Tax=Enterobacteriaceae TaxID=543 RepID=UPI002026154B
MASVSISCPSCSATDGVVRNGKSTAGHQRYLCSHCRKTWQLQFTYTASQPGTHQKIIDMAMNGVGCRATARIMGVGLNTIFRHLKNGTVAKLAMRQPFVLFKGLTFQKLCLPGAFRPGDHHNKMLRPG